MRKAFGKVAASLLRKTEIDVDLASSGDECIAKVRKFKYDIIMLTANVVSGAREQFMEEGFNDYLSKPFTLEEIQSMLLKHLPEDKRVLNNIE